LDGSDIDHALVPGDYYSGGAAISVTGDVYLKLSANAAENDIDEWNFVVTGGALSTAASNKMYFVKHDAAELVAGPYTAVSWEVAAAIAIGSASEMIGTMTAIQGGIVTGAKAKTGNLNAQSGAINLGADSTSGDLRSGAAITLGAGASAGKIVAFAVGAVTLGADATANGYITANGGAVTLGAGAIANGHIKASAAITLGAGTASCGICAGGAIVAGAGAVFDGATIDGTTFACVNDHKDCEGTCTAKMGDFYCDLNDVNAPN
jgi:hypothetical protein